MAVFECQLEIISISWTSDQKCCVLTPAICIAVARCVIPLIFVRCMPSNSFPKSVVRVTSISGPLPAMFMRPTDDSGFACVLAEKMRLTASAWASHLDGLCYGKYKSGVLTTVGRDALHIITVSAALAVVQPNSHALAGPREAGVGRAHTIIVASSTILMILSPLGSCY